MKDINVTELARRLNISTKDLLERLPEMGFPIGKKAIKIKAKMAQEIIQKWDIANKMYEGKLKQELDERRGARKASAAGKDVPKKQVKIPAFITVREYADRTEIPVPQVIQTLMKNGIFASLNERIDFDTAQIIGDDLDIEVIEDEAVQEIDAKSEKTVENIIGKEESTEDRAPVIVVMGHVDHGKTRLLDTIRETNVVEGEAGGITQHIGAYQVEKKGKKLTFIDTPGHEAFTAMRSRGARIADIAILIVAADDSIKPQTIEALRIIQQSELPMIVAINKIDKPDANLDRVKSDLAQNNLNPQEWGGNTIVAEVSALKGTGIDDLLDFIILLADEHQDKIQANEKGTVVGTVIESHVDKGEGPVATMLVQNGTLTPGGYLGIDGTLYGRVRAMKDWNGNFVQSAGPSTPVKLLGFKVSPKVGDIIVVSESQKDLKKKIAYQDLVRDTVATAVQASTSDDEEDENKVKYNIILKSDVLGSLEAIVESLEKIHHPEVSIKVVQKGLGNITERDVLQAESSKAVILAFHVKPTPNSENLARDKKVEIKQYKVIYDLLNDVKENLETLLGDEVIETEVGDVEIIALFGNKSAQSIAGGKVTKGKIVINAKVLIYREGIEIGEGKVASLQIAKEAVTDVEKGNECGFGIESKVALEKEDTLKVFTIQTKKKTL
jgi:translation initiation factor IF-2